ncbi:MAG: GNAT family N-acetyltransferase [Sandaracinus sp.]|nr:GNAT family N-acetyltransferase [Sandaracinus sp.]
MGLGRRRGAGGGRVLPEARLDGADDPGDRPSALDSPRGRSRGRHARVGRGLARRGRRDLGVVDSPALRHAGRARRGGRSLARSRGGGRRLRAACVDAIPLAHAQGDRSFDDFLGRFRSSERKKVRKERRAVVDAGLEIAVRPGSELSASDWELLRRFYRDTCMRKGSHPYLTNRFFDLAATRLAHVALGVFALRDGEPVAATLSFEKGAHLYGRYWGCLEDHEMLHFELCYYQLIERAIARGVTRFEAGAQGGHKLKRGLLPAEVHSVHWIADPRLRFGVQEFLQREAAQVRRQIAMLEEHGPFRRDTCE